jgi:hypothetical protein
MKEIEEKIDLILSSVDLESIVVYEFLKTEFNKGSIIKNDLFRFSFRAYYGLESGGLSKKFKEEYFIQLEKHREKEPCFEEIVARLYQIPNLTKEKNPTGESLQVSFTSKLIHTIDNTFPIYDSKVEKYMRWQYIPNDIHKDKCDNLKKRIEGYGRRIKELGDYYKDMIEYKNGLFLEKFEQNFPKINISPEKKIDFILWTAGKIGIKK